MADITYCTRNICFFDLVFCYKLKEDLAIIEGTDLSKKDDSRWAGPVATFVVSEVSRLPLGVAEQDVALLDVLAGRTSIPRAEVCAAAVWRVQVQGLTLMAYTFLCDFGFVDYSGLEKVVELGEPEWHTWHVMNALSEFEFFQKLCNPPAVAISGPKAFKAPLWWLAVMIVRGTRVDKLHSILEFLDTIGIVGKLNRSNVHWPATCPLRRLPEAMVPDPTKRPKPIPMAFHLPMGAPSDEEKDDQLEGFCRVFFESRDVFKKYFRLDKEGIRFPTMEL